uniref:Uncharacterized protein n=1 Tax=Mycena chlorophos TaxID=658473 RepID=A0ABQ0LPI2_MYCCL|nr:predicted protein [Mycena chlorophos]
MVTQAISHPPALDSRHRVPASVWLGVPARPALFDNGHSQSLGRPRVHRTHCKISAPGDDRNMRNPDLTLRDASEITFYYDAEDEQPISGPSSKPMHPLVAGIAPLQKVAGVRHSNRKPKLSARAKAARDLDSDTDASASSTKRKATSPGRKTVTKAARLAGSASAATAAEAASGTDSDGSGSGDNYEEQKQSDAVPTSGDDALETTDTEDEDATIQARGAFEKFKAMGDADHAKAIQTKSRSDKTADIRLMFIKKKDYPHPDTGVPTNGHICIICDADGEIGIQVFFTGSA